MRRRSFVLVLVLVGCSSGGGSSSGAPADDAAIDVVVPPPPAIVCDAPSGPVDTSKPTTVVGKGTPDGCTEDALRAAATTGGVVTFDCGAAPVTIAVAKEIAVAKDTVIDGGNKVTLSGGGKSRILHITSAWNVATPLLTVQNLAFQGGFTTDAPNTKSTSQGGAAIFEDGGSLTVIHCTFTDNHCASTGQDVSGGAINGQGVGTLVVVDSIFSGNSGSNGGAIGTQDENVTIVDSTFTQNSATGTDGNPGNGGDGGALSYDGADVSLTFCGDTFRGNHANAAGGAVFRVGYHDEAVAIDRCIFDANAVDTTSGNAGGLYLEHVAIDMTATTISNNQANFGGGLWAGQSAIAQLTNVTIAGNNANMGGGIWFANAVTGTLLNCTVADNQGDGLFGGDTGVKLQNTLVVDNLAGTMDHATNCQKPHGDGGPVMQFPTGGGAQCTASTVYADPKIGALADNGGPTFTMAIPAGSPAIGKGSGCPATDQRGNARTSACTLGAYEAE